MSRPLNDPENLVRLAEESTSPPPYPEGGLPKQKVPGWIRWPLRVMVLPFVLLDLFSQRIARKFIKTPYREEGGCKQRGNCCYYILFPAPVDFLSKMFYFWNTEINGFYARDPKQFEDPLIVDGEKFAVMGCRYLQKDGRCGHHKLRPTICRTWPIIEYFGPPRILKGCGYRAVARDPKFDPFPQAHNPDINPPENKFNILE